MRQRIQGVQIGFYFGFIGVSLLELFFWQKDSFLNRAETDFLADEAWPAVTNLESSFSGWRGLTRRDKFGIRLRTKNRLETQNLDFGFGIWKVKRVLKKWKGFEKVKGFWKSEAAEKYFGFWILFIKIFWAEKYFRAVRIFKIIFIFQKRKAIFLFSLTRIDFVFLNRQ